MIKSKEQYYKENIEFMKTFKGHIQFMDYDDYVAHELNKINKNE